MNIIARFLFENSLLDPFWSSWLAGYCVVAEDGKIYLTEAGGKYLETVGESNPST